LIDFLDDSKQCGFGSKDETFHRNAQRKRNEQLEIIYGKDGLGIIKIDLHNVLL